MNQEELFWKFYNLVQSEIDKKKKGDLTSLECVDELEALRKLDENFFYQLVVFGDEMIINIGGQPFLERIFSVLQRVEDEFLTKSRNYKKKLPGRIAKKNWRGYITIC